MESEGWMRLVDGFALGGERVKRASVSAIVIMAAMFGVAACAGPSPTIQTAASDASAPATADADAAGGTTVDDSALAAAREPDGDASDATESASEASNVESAEPSEAQATQATMPPVDEPASADTPEESAPVASTTTPPDDTAATTDAVEEQPAPAAASPPAAIEAPEQTQTANSTGGGGMSPPGSGLATGRPYVVIRFPESNVDYEKPLSEAIKRALARRPNLAFDLVAVTPRASSADELADLTQQAKAEAAAVMKSLSDLGIGPDRVSMIAWTGQPTDVNEIRLYIR